MLHCGSVIMFSTVELIKADYAQEYLLLYEKYPLCMLPPPLNAVTILLAPLHYWTLKKYNISFAGTVADMLLRLVYSQYRRIILVAL